MINNCVDKFIQAEHSETATAVTSMDYENQLKWSGVDSRVEKTDGSDWTAQPLII